MPYTPSHIAAVLPLRGKGGAGLPLAGLAAGSMSPDLVYFLPTPNWAIAAQTHSWWGILTWDLLLGTCLWLAWRLASHSLHGLVPDPIRRRWRPAGWPSSLVGFALVVAAVVVGSATHVLWDEFTHVGRFGATHLPLLAASYPTPIGMVPGFRLLQYASTVIGLASVVWVGLRQPVVWDPPRSQPALARAAAWLVPAGTVAAVIARLTVVDLTSRREVTFAAATVALTGAIATTALLCLVHAVRTFATPR
ncbi:MAG: DUF4184 family protein [Propionicimonas sp.]